MNFVTRARFHPSGIRSPGWRLFTVLCALSALAGCAGQPADKLSPPAAATPAPATPAPVVIQVHAAGSLRSALMDLAKVYERSHPEEKIALTFGPSGLLKDRLAAGEASQVFASANMEHPEALLKAGRAEQVQPFAVNALCGLARPQFSLQGKPLATRLLEADVRLATSTPKADPAGDYAFRMFELIETTGAGPTGSAQALKAKALQLTGGPNAPPPPAGRNIYGVLVAEDRADVFITYCTNAAQARSEVPELQVLEVPAPINVAARYGVALLKPATPQARSFIAAMQSPEGRAALAVHGFRAP